jgi:hypothetical protein
MFCPNCGLERASTETTFCSRCGFLLTGAAELIASGGQITSPVGPVTPAYPSPRSRGIRQGIFIFLLSFLVVPLIAILTMAVGAEPYLVVISAILLSVGGLLRVAYALMFESPQPFDKELEGSGFKDAAARMLGRKPDRSALPGAHTIGVDNYMPPARSWSDTNDLQPRSVTENTTKLLEEDRSQ